MSTDVSLSHTIDDDITFEKVRHMPRRTQFVSTHRQLTWQHEKMLKQHERDQRLSHSELSRAKTLMADKLTRLQGVKKQMEKQKGEPANLGGRESVPGLENVEAAADSAKGSRESGMTATSIHSGLPGPRPATKQPHSTPSTKSIQQPQASSSVMMNCKQPYPAHSKPGQTTSKQISFALAQHNSSHLEDDSNSKHCSKEVSSPAADSRGGYRRVRILSLTPAASGGSGDSPDSDLQTRRVARRATIAEGGARETSKLPPHLLQKLAEFMDKTEAFLLAPAPVPARAIPRSHNDGSGNNDSSGLRKSQSAGQLCQLERAERQPDEQPGVDAVTD